MAKKLLISDNKLDWIKNTSVGTPKPATAKKSPIVKKTTVAKKTEAPKKIEVAKKAETAKKPVKAAKPKIKSVPKKSVQPETPNKTTTTETRKKTVVVKASQPNTGLKAAGVPKRPLAPLKSPATSPIIKAIAHTKERKKTKPNQVIKGTIIPNPPASMSLDDYEDSAEAMTVRSMPKEESIIRTKMTATLSEAGSTKRMAVPSITRENASMPIDEIPLPADSLPQENKISGKVLYLLSIAALICAAIFLPERYSMLVFLGFIFISIIVVSFRVAEQQRLIKSIKENRNSWLTLLHKK
jgi:hypothetical protein